MSLTAQVKEFVGSVDAKFADDQCNLSYNKLEFIDLVHRVEEHFGIEIEDRALNHIANIKDLTEEVAKAIG